MLVIDITVGVALGYTLGRVLDIAWRMALYKLKAPKAQQEALAQLKQMEALFRKQQAEGKKSG